MVLHCVLACSQSTPSKYIKIRAKLLKIFMLHSQLVYRKILNYLLMDESVLQLRVYVSLNIFRKREIADN